MDFQNKGRVEVFMFLGKAILVFLAGGIVFHMIVMIIDYFLMIDPFYMDLRNNFTGSIFSEPMMPMMGVYGLLTLSIYFLWKKTKKAALMVREKEFQKNHVTIKGSGSKKLTVDENKVLTLYLHGASCEEIAKQTDVDVEIVTGLLEIIKAKMSLED